MAINNQFGFNQGFTTGFQQTGFQNNQFQNTQPTYKTQNNKYPGVDDETMKRIEQLADSKGLKGQDKENFIQSAYRQVVNQAVNNTQLQDRDTQINNMCYDAAVSGNKGKEVASRVSTLAQDIKKRYPEYRKANDDDNEVIQWFVGALMDKGHKKANQEYCDYIEKGDTSFLYNYNLETPSVKEQTGIGGAGLGLGTAVGVYGLSYLGKPIESLGKAIYGNVVPTSDYEAQQLEKAGEFNKELKLDIKDQKKVVREAKAELRKAKSSGEGIEEAQAALDEAKNTLTKLRETPKQEVRTAIDTAIEENLKGTKKGIAEKAGAIRNRIWKKEIQTVIDANPDVKINLKDAFSEFVEEAKSSVAELDNMKKEEMSRALKKLEKWYNRNSDLENATLQQVQDLKSSIQKTLKDVYEKQAKQGEISTFDKLLEKYASKLREKLQNKLQELAPNKKIKDLYKKRAENDMIAEQGIKENLLKGNVKENIIKKGRQQVESRVGKMFAKQGKRANALKEFVNKGAKTLWEDVAKNGAKEAKTLLKRGLKKGAKGLLDPVAIVMPDSRDIIDSQKLGIPTLKRIASGNPNYTDRKMEELLNKEGATYDTAIAEMLDHLKNNDEFNRTATWLKKNRVTTYREAVEDLWNEDPDELIELFENYLANKNGLQ